MVVCKVLEDARAMVATALWEAAFTGVTSIVASSPLPFATHSIAVLFLLFFIFHLSDRQAYYSMSELPQYTDEVAPQHTSANSKKNYGATPSAEEAAVQAPLLASGSRNAWMDQPSADDLPDDFKVGVNVIDCDAEIRMAFIRKVYSILLVQLVVTGIVSLALYQPAAVAFHQEHPWIIWIPMVCSFASLFGVYWKRHQHPANLILLGLFTIFEAMLIGTITSYYESRIVSSLRISAVSCLFLGPTSSVHKCRGLPWTDVVHIPDEGKTRPLNTLFSLLTSQIDFSFLGPFLFAGIMGLLTASLVQIFLPFNAGLDFGIAIFGVLLFSGFIIYDTQTIMKRMSVDEAIISALCLYLDAANLFLSILRLVSVLRVEKRLKPNL